MVSKWNEQGVINTLAGSGKFEETGGAVLDVTQNLITAYDINVGGLQQLGPGLESAWNAEVIRCESERARILEQHSWPLISKSIIKGPGDSTGCGWDPRREFDLSYLPINATKGSLQEKGWRMETEVRNVEGWSMDTGAQNVAHSRIKTHYIMHEPLGMRTGRGPQVIQTSSSGYLGPYLQRGDVVVAVNGILITRGEYQVAAILDAHPKLEPFSVAIRRKGATPDGTSVDKFEPSDLDPEPFKSASSARMCAFLDDCSVS